MDTSGFYKLDVESGFMFAPNFVYGPKVTLVRKDKDLYIYPIEGWKWFDTEEVARIEYGVAHPVVLGDLKETIMEYEATEILTEKISLIDNCITILLKEKETLRLETGKVGK